MMTRDELTQQRLIFVGERAECLDQAAYHEQAAREARQTAERLTGAIGFVDHLLSLADGPERPPESLEEQQ